MNIKEYFSANPSNPQTASTRMHRGALVLFTIVAVAQLPAASKGSFYSCGSCERSYDALRYDTPFQEKGLDNDIA